MLNLCEIEPLMLSFWAKVAAITTQRRERGRKLASEEAPLKREGIVRESQDSSLAGFRCLLIVATRRARPS